MRTITLVKVDPLTIYISIIGLLLVLTVLLGVFSYHITRGCPQCNARVQLGRPRCQGCGYRFSTARF